MEIICGCLYIFWTVNVHNSFHQTSIRCRNQDVNSEVRKKPVFSVPENNPLSCAVICLRDIQCQHFVYSRHDKRCNGYKDDICDDGGNNGTARYVVYRNVCSNRCPKKTATYTLTFKTRKEQDSGSKADLYLAISGQCETTDIELTNGRDVRLWRGRRTTFKFTRNSVCGVDGIALAFSDACNKDDWFIEDVVVEYEEMDTGDRDRVKFEINYWLRAADNITGVGCTNDPSVVGSSQETGGAADCAPFQTCDRH